MKAKILWFLVFVYLVIIFYFSNQSKLPIKTTNEQNNYLHFFEYFFLNVLWSAAYHSINLSPFFSVISSIIYAITDELHQSFVPGRDCSFDDLSIDIIASFLGFLTFSLIKARI